MLDDVMDGLEKRRTAPVADRGMVVSVVSWILLVAMVFTLITRLSMKFAVIKKGPKFGLDDIFIVLAALFSVGQTAVVSMEAMHVLGQHKAELSDKQLRMFQKAEYAGCMLYIANMGCSRISVCLLIKKVLPGSGVRYTCCGFAILSIIWTIADILVTAFPCELPDPWNFLGKDCIDIVKFVLHIGVTNIWIEVVLIVMPLIVWNLRLSAGSSISVSAVFLSRLSVIAAVAAELVYFSRSARSKDLTYDMWSTVLCKQIAQNLSIITACLPCFHPFMLSILSGAVKAEKLRYDYKKRWTVKCMFNRRRGNFDATTSQSSTRPMKDSMTDHCRPLATHGLIRSSTHINSQQFNNFPPDIESPMEKPREPENVFMRHIDISDTSPGSFSSAQPLQPAPKDLSQVGIIPTPDWDTGSSDRSSAQSDRSRRPGSDYVFSRQKVISVPENNAMYDQDSWRRYPPPPKSGEK